MRSSKPNGITLVEVVAGLALMGSLLTVALVGSSQHLRQMKTASLKRQAASQLDEFLASWSVDRFSRDGLQDAAARTGMTVIGDLGAVGVDDLETESRSRFYVEIIKVGPAAFGNGANYRVNVKTIDRSRKRRAVTWAEVVTNR